MRIIINGDPREVPAHITIADLIAHLALTPERLAVERNREVVRRREWPATELQENDRIEVIHFVGGG